jgi:hypothetical protein
MFREDNTCRRDHLLLWEDISGEIDPQSEEGLFAEERSAKPSLQRT